MFSMLRRFLANESGLSSVEYGLVVTFLGVWSLIGLDAAGVVSLVDLSSELR
jgi:Flp pilus assembly pilin Flp